LSYCRTPVLDVPLDDYGREFWIKILDDPVQSYVITIILLENMNLELV
jgi:hypothetical protein